MSHSLPYLSPHKPPSPPSNPKWELISCLIHTRGPLQWPNLMQVDSGSEFKGDFAKAMKADFTQIRMGEPGNNQQQGIVERFNRTL